jgi:hypothetical protein
MSWRTVLSLAATVMLGCSVAGELATAGKDTDANTHGLRQDTTPHSGVGRGATGPLEMAARTQVTQCDPASLLNGIRFDGVPELSASKTASAVDCCQLCTANVSCQGAFGARIIWRVTSINALPSRDTPAPVRVLTSAPRDTHSRAPSLSLSVITHTHTHTHARARALPPSHSTSRSQLLMVCGPLQDSHGKGKTRRADCAN